MVCGMFWMDWRFLHLRNVLLSIAIASEAEAAEVAEVEAAEVVAEAAEVEVAAAVELHWRRSKSNIRRPLR